MLKEASDFFFYYSMCEREVKLIQSRFLSQCPWNRSELKGSEAGKGLGPISDGKWMGSTWTGRCEALGSYFVFCCCEKKKNYDQN